jgi:hypothetical protein
LIVKISKTIGEKGNEYVKGLNNNDKNEQFIKLEPILNNQVVGTVKKEEKRVNNIVGSSNNINSPKKSPSKNKQQLRKPPKGSSKSPEKLKNKNK